MRMSRNGKWFLDDEKRQFYVDGLDIRKIKRYLFGFNSVTLVIELDEYKETEYTYSRGYFKKLTFSSIEEAMENIIKANSNFITNSEESQRIYEYKSYLIKYYPEKLLWTI